MSELEFRICKKNEPNLFVYRGKDMLGIISVAKSDGRIIFVEAYLGNTVSEKEQKQIDNKMLSMGRLSTN